MALTQKLLIRQSQALVMTPQLMQAIKLLELSNMDLTAYVEGELERNPLLEQAGDGEASVAAAAPHEPGLAQDILPGADAVPERPASELDDVPPADANATASRTNGEDAPRYSEWPRQV